MAGKPNLAHSAKRCQAVAGQLTALILILPPDVAAVRFRLGAAGGSSTRTHWLVRSSITRGLFGLSLTLSCAAKQISAHRLYLAEHAQRVEAFRSASIEGQDAESLLLFVSARDHRLFHKSICTAAASLAGTVLSNLRALA